jgi:hypothetical protein
LVGTAQDADTAQLPQSISPVPAWSMHAGWLWGSATDGVIVVISRAPAPPYHPSRRMSM